MSVERDPARKWWTFGAISIGTFQCVLIINMVNLALPTLVADLGTDVTTVQWVVLAYSLTMAGLLLGFGCLADVIGRKRVYIAGFVLFGTGAALCSVAQGISGLVGSRVVQGIGGAMLVSNSMAIITEVFPSTQRGRALGLNATVVALASLTGPSLSGWLIDGFGWRAIFRTHVLLSAVGATISLVALPRTERRADQRFDFLGALSLSISVFSLTLALNQGRRQGWNSPYIVGLFGLWVLSSAAFIVIDTRVEDPVLDLRLLRNRMFTIGNVCVFISSFALAGLNFVLPFFFQGVLAYTPSEMGVRLMTQPIVQAMVGPLSGWLADRLEARHLTSAGLGVAGLGILLLSGLSPAATDPAVILRLVLLGVGFGLFQTANNYAVMGSVKRTRIGTAGGFLGTMRHLGMITGVAGIGAIFAARSAYHGGLEETAALAGGFRNALWVVAGICLLGALVSLTRGREAPTRRLE
jgi:EmrB/QacA subfamily drug resistance transporter